MKEEIHKEPHVTSYKHYLPACMYFTSTYSNNRRAFCVYNKKELKRRKIWTPEEREKDKKRHLEYWKKILEEDSEENIWLCE